MNWTLRQIAIRTGAPAIGYLLLLAIRDVSRRPVSASVGDILMTDISLVAAVWAIAAGAIWLVTLLRRNLPTPKDSRNR